MATSDNATAKVFMVASPGRSIFFVSANSARLLRVAILWRMVPQSGRPHNMRSVSQPFLVCMTWNGSANAAPTPARSAARIADGLRAPDRSSSDELGPHLDHRD